jgi:hypothetical protein
MQFAVSGPNLMTRLLDCRRHSHVRHCIYYYSMDKHLDDIFVKQSDAREVPEPSDLHQEYHRPEALKFEIA